MLPASTTIGELIDDLAARVFSRIPLYGDTRDDVKGYIIQRDALDELIRGGGRDKPLQELARTAWFLPEMTSIAAALPQFLQRREHLAMVIDEFGSVSGLVTLEDLIETILGMEIVDESDRTTDMRKLAAKLRDQRMDKLRVERGATMDAPPPSAQENGSGMDSLG